ncbi:hypothetical protein AMTR_s00003p00122970 [Amborella trichopoda]|uniref:GH3 C-terminal domain-containing protein n=1 Tax=Amborella trichopoda TaxID=13333 RepID=W1P020_AMBTC|nr:hypothetical protein AMTR_s00003p00122970 [Amborella trichopoda]
MASRFLRYDAPLEERECIDQIELKVRREYELVNTGKDRQGPPSEGNEVTGEVLRHEHGAPIANYTSYADSNTIPGNYVILWELYGEGAPKRGDGQVLLGDGGEDGTPCIRKNWVERSSIGPLDSRVVSSHLQPHCPDLPNVHHHYCSTEQHSWPELLSLELDVCMQSRYQC